MKAVVFIDSGHLRVLVRNASYKYDPDYIETVANACTVEGETLFRADRCRRYAARARHCFLCK